jgi:hypothetical protein
MLGAVQAQDYEGAKWALSLRSGLTDAHIEREFAAGSILRTHVLRPTWHFVAPADIRWMLALTAPRVCRAMASSNRRLELTPAVFHRSHAAITKALRGGRQLNRAELGAVLARARIGVVSGQRLAHLMAQAELDGVVCSGERRGRQFTYALLEERVPPAPVLERDAALLELTLRYFTTRGPATAHDFAWWSGLGVTDAREGIQAAGRALERTDVGERTYWSRSGATPPPPTARSAHLLPNYDEYFIGFRDRSAIGQRLGHVSSVTGGDARITHVVVVDGQLVGGWRRSLSGKEAVVRAELQAKLTAAEVSRVRAAARRYGDFLGMPVRLDVA